MGIDVLAAERRERLLDALRRDGRVVAKRAAADLGVTEDLIRRDLRELAAAGLCQRVYGGALPASPAVVDLAARGAVATGSKQRVADAAARLVLPGSTVLLDGGTTALAVARALPPDLRATAITHSPVVAAALIGRPGLEIHVIGGRLYQHSGVACGAAAVEAAQQLGADLFLLGVTGIHPDAGFTTGDPEEAAMKRVLAARAADTWVLASSEKVGAASAHRVLGLDAVTGVVTDADPDHPALRAVEAAGGTVLTADGSPDRSPV